MIQAFSSDFIVVLRRPITYILSPLSIPRPHALQPIMLVRSSRGVDDGVCRSLLPIVSNVVQRPANLLTSAPVADVSKTIEDDDTTWLSLSGNDLEKDGTT